MFPQSNNVQNIFYMFALKINKNKLILNNILF